MKILINCSTIVVGGAVQVAFNLISYTLKDKQNIYYYLLSTQVYNQVENLGINKESFFLINNSPAGFIKGRKERKKIQDIEKRINPEIVYSVGAPSYVKFSVTEVLRLTNPYVIGADKLAFSVLPFYKRIIEKIKLNVKRFYINKNHIIITQTNDAKNKIIENIKIPSKNVKVIPNVCSEIFFKKTEYNRNDECFNILVFAAPYPHKNLDIIPEVAYHLKKKGVINFRFILTISEKEKSDYWITFKKKCERLEVFDSMLNFGRVNFNEAPMLYDRSDMLFLPTVLEVFSVTYLEAMAKSLPIVTTDLSFSRDVCNNAALYFEPKNPLDAAEKIFLIMTDVPLKNKLKKSMQNIIENYYSPEYIYKQHIEILNEAKNQNEK